MWAPVLLVSAFVIALLSRPKKSEASGHVWIVITVSLFLGVVGLQGIEPVRRDGFGNWGLLFAPFVVAYWGTVFFCLVWPVVVVLQGERGSRLMFLGIPFFLVGVVLLTISVTEHRVANKVLVDDRKFWSTVMEKGTVDLPIEEYRRHLSSAGKDAVRHQLHYSDDFSAPMLRLLRDLGFDVSKEPNLDIALILELKEQGDKNQRRFVKGSPSAYALNASLAANPATPPELLEEFGENMDSEVVFAVASNPKAPPQLLKKILRDSTARYAEGMKKTGNKRDGWALSQDKKIIERAEKSLARHR